MKPNFDSKTDIRSNKEKSDRESSLPPVREVVREVIVQKELPVQSIQPSQNVVTLEDARLMRDQAVDYALEKYSKMQSTVTKKQDDEDNIGFSTKIVKQLQETVGVFNALKQFASNPLQTAIEQKIGGAAAQMVEKVFTPQQPPQSQDIIDKVLNSSFGAGLGASVGQHGPELADKIISLFGKEKAEKWIDSSIAGRGDRIGGGTGGGTGGMGTRGGQQQGNSEIDLILELDPNNPEHISAYAKSQGGISNDVARKMLMVHQDDFIKQMHDSGDGNSIERANNIMLRRNQQLTQEQEKKQEIVDYENIQEYKQPSKKQNIDQLESDAVIPDDLRKSQAEPDALVRTENYEKNIKEEKNEKVMVTENVVFEMEEVQQKGNLNSDNIAVQTEIETNVYLRSLTEMTARLFDKVEAQSVIISELQNDLNSVKDKDIEKVKKKNDKLDEEIFTGVRKVKGIKMQMKSGTGMEKIKEI